MTSFVPALTCAVARRYLRSMASARELARRASAPRDNEDPSMTLDPASLVSADQWIHDAALELD